MLMRNVRNSRNVTFVANVHHRGSHVLGGHSPLQRGKTTESRSRTSNLIGSTFYVLQLAVGAKFAAQSNEQKERNSKKTCIVAVGIIHIPPQHGTITQTDTNPNRHLCALVQHLVIIKTIQACIATLLSLFMDLQPLN